MGLQKIDPGRTRTCNLWFRRPTPYPLGHRAPCKVLDLRGMIWPPIIGETTASTWSCQTALKALWCIVFLWLSYSEEAWMYSWPAFKCWSTKPTSYRFGSWQPQRITPCGTRTRNLRIRSPTPCPLGQGGLTLHASMQSSNPALMESKSQFNNIWTHTFRLGVSGPHQGMSWWSSICHMYWKTNGGLRGG